MKKNKRFLLRLSDEDILTLENVSQFLQRSKSDAFRWALYEVAIALKQNPDNLRLLKQVKRPR